MPSRLRKVCLPSAIDESDSNIFYEEEKSGYRPSTAPARPLTELEEFRRSDEFFLLEQAVMSTSQLIQKSNNKYDLDTPEGQKACKKYLKCIEKLQEVHHFPSIFFCLIKLT
jgi:hypothetical protein